MRTEKLNVQLKSSDKELILATRPFAKEDRFKSWFYTLSTLALVIVCFAGTFLSFSTPVKLIFSILSGLILVRMFVIYHDHQHHSILYKSKIADFIFSIIGIFMLAPTSIWKRSHDHHHNHNSKFFSSDIGSYPIMTKEKFLNSTKSERFYYLLVRHPLTMAFGYISMFLYWMCLQSFMSSPRRHYDSLIALIIHFTIAFCLVWFIGWQALLFSLVIPFTLTFAIGAYLFYAQHNFPDVVFKNNSEWSYSHAALESSSYMKMNPFWRWISANIGYHHVHHLNSRIPFYRLPEVMAKFPQLQNPKITTLNPTDIIRCVRLKVWDPEKNRMIGMKEIYS